MRIASDGSHDEISSAGDHAIAAIRVVERQPQRSQQLLGGTGFDCG
jgi:hypothetical protein